MCRIAGIVSTKGDNEHSKALVNIMCNAMQHGGPDDAGIFEDENANLVFGHRRLSIIDLSNNGHQPMADCAKKAWITFNGEIYNYLELKHQLKTLGAQFTSETDTEVIIQAYLYWGVAAFNKLRGMFAFALYDTAAEEVFLVRDSGGIKPLYYSTINGSLAFASELRAFKAAGIAPETDLRWPVWLLAYGHIPEPHTTLKEVSSLPKGHYLHKKKNGSYALHKFVSNKPSNYITDKHAAEEGIFQTLQNAVKRQLIADAPLGVFLSGGIDSAIIALLANSQKQQLKTVSIFFDEKSYDERLYQNTVVNHLNGENFKHLVKERDFEEYFPDILTAMDMPTTDGINSWFISKYAHDNGLKAVLSGVGADELYGGYPSFERIKWIKYLRMLPKPLLARASHIQASNYKRLAYLAYDHPAADYLFLRGFYTPVDIAQILNMSQEQVSNILFGFNPLPPVGKYDGLHASWFETNLYMQNQLLRDTDVMSMSHGLEVRVPFLDEDLGIFTQQISHELRFAGDRPKKILIDSFKTLLPEVVWSRPKMGFTFPLQQWMKNNEYIADESHYQGKFAKAIINDFKQGKGHWSKAYALYQIQKHA
ncbi:asparagine synthase (glutamine-hydrolyzing) [Mucilaginibacter psychrotolerans]|uniref:asparagine synthase (glutamine-hydrolyzing) n=1 Tax=Mucilaginibacter psychrotolerans TaxID=1524096 RepID=A0A4Y8SR80_9SPHI|nr:asparagine synthase (glutamine-hydrolyzing) [Mucilaginibacter psychrotolerans]TFF40884.1 asparagine synthase (glutamine-hydrolyzing) [Mucilaginibacter psychrotolerans]